MPEKKYTALLLIDMQEGFSDSKWGQRNNPKIEKSIQALLVHFRNTHQLIVHIQHLSTEADSPLRPGQPGVEFRIKTQPKLGERIFQKTVHNAFQETTLETYLRSEKIQKLILVGIATDHCISTNARMASNLGFEVVVVEDGTATFERQGKKIYSAELVHEISLASLRGEFADIITTKALLAEQSDLHA